MLISFEYYLVNGISLLFFVLMIVFVVHALFLGYHWFSYGTNRNISLSALALYLTGGAILLLTYAYALTLL